MEKIVICFILSVLLLFINCSEKPTVLPQHIYFGGEIINPNADFVVLYNRDGMQDTIHLDANNRFFRKYDSLSNGLYRIFHQPEAQMILLEKGDSLLARLNTIEFDESIVFSGKGAAKNNFLMDMFLLNENERKQYNENKFKQSPSIFLKEIDSLKKRRFNLLYKLKERTDLSPLASQIMEASFQYHFYTDIETYPLRHFGSNLDNAKTKFATLPSTFFDYRKSLNLNNSDLKLSYEYHRFLTRYIENTAYMDFAIANNYKEEEPNATLHKMELIDSTFSEAYVRKIQLGGIARQFIDFNEDSISSKKVLAKYLEINSDSSSAKRMKKVVEYTTKLVPGNLIPNQKLIASDSTMVNLSDLTTRNPLTAIYFWSVLDIQYYRKAHIMVAKLREKYPEVQFISINIDEDKTKKWINILDTYEYLRDFEYQFDDAGKSRNELVLYQFTRDKTILLGKNGKILNPNANLFDPKFEPELNIYTNQQKTSSRFLK